MKRVGFLLLTGRSLKRRKKMNTKALFSVLGVTILALVLALGLMIPTAQNAGACTPQKLTVMSSGCAEVGVYYWNTAPSPDRWELIGTVQPGETKIFDVLSDW